MYKVTECLNIIKNIFFPEPPKYTELQFTQKAYAKLMCYINLIGDYEITGFGRIVDNKIVDIKILEQEVKKATVDCDLDSMTAFLMSIPEEQAGQWTLDWHSHVDMAVFASGTDASNYEEQWEARMKKQFPYIIVNKKQQYYARCYINPDRETEIKITMADDGITQEDIEEIYKECKYNIEQFCTVKQEYNFSRNGIYQLTPKKKEEKEEKEIVNRYNNSYDYEDYCWQCGSYLWTAEEYDYHVCNKCWNGMTPEERKAWAAESYQYR